MNGRLFAAIALLGLLLTPSVSSGITASSVELEWERFTIRSTGTTDFEATATNGDKLAVLFTVGTTSLRMALVDSSGTITNKTVVTGSDTIQQATIAFMTGQKWVVAYYNVTTADFMVATTTDDGDSWTHKIASTFTEFATVPYPVLVNANNIQYSTASGQRHTFSTDGGLTWSQSTCGAGLANPIFIRSGTEYTVYGTKTGNPDINKLVLRFSDDSCSTFESLWATGDYAVSGCPTGVQPGIRKVGGNFQIIAGSGNNDSDGLCLWDGVTEDGAELLVTDAAGSSTPRPCACGDDVQAVTYSRDNGARGLAWDSTGLYDPETIHFGSITALVGTAQSEVQYFDGRLGLGYDDGGDVFAWISSPLPAEELPVEPSEFEEGFKSFINSAGFKTPESKYLVGLVLLAGAIVTVAYLTVRTSDDKSRLKLMALTAGIVIVANIFLVGWQVWQAISIFMVGGSIFISTLKDMGTVAQPQLATDGQQIMFTNRFDVQEQLDEPLEPAFDVLDATVESGETEDEPENQTPEPVESDSSIEGDSET